MPNTGTDYVLGNIKINLKATGAKTVAKDIDKVLDRITALNNKLSSIGVSNADNVNKTLDKASKNVEKISKSSGKASKHIGKMFSLGKLYFWLNFTKRIADNITGMVTSAINFDETLNKYQVAMGTNYEQGLKFVNDFTKAFNLSTESIMNYQATFKNMLDALGDLSTNTTYQLSETLTRMAVDYSSLFNVQIEKSMQQFQAVLAGNIRSIRTTSGFDVSEQTIFNIYRALGGEKTMRQLDQTEKRLLRIIALQEQMEKTGAVGDFQKTITNTANVLKQISETFKEIGMWLGQLLKVLIAPLLEKVLGVAIAFREMVKALNIMRGYQYEDFGKGGLFGGIEEGADDAKESVDSLKKSLLGFDTLNILGNKTATNEIVTTDYDFLVDKIKSYSQILSEVENKYANIAESILKWAGFTKNAEKDIWEFNPTQGEGGIITFIFSRIDSIINKIIDKIIQLIQKLLDNMPQIIETIFAVLKNANVSFANILPKILDIILQIILSIIDLLPSVISKLSTLTEDLSSRIGDIITNFIEKVAENLPTIIETIFQAVKSINISIENILPKILDIILQIILNIIELLPDIIDKITYLTQDISSKVTDVIVDFIKKIADNMSQIIENIIKIIASLVKSTSVLTGDIIFNIIDGIVNAIIELIKGIINALPNTIEQLPTLLVAVIESILGLLPKLIDLITDVIVAILEALPDIIAKILEIAINPSNIMNLLVLVGDLITAIVKVSVQILIALVELITKVLWASIKLPLKLIAKLFGLDKFAKQLDNISKLISNQFNDVKAKINNFFSTIGKFFENIRERFKSAFAMFKNSKDEPVLIDPETNEKTTPNSKKVNSFVSAFIPKPLMLSSTIPTSNYSNVTQGQTQYISAIVQTIADGNNRVVNAVNNSGNKPVYLNNKKVSEEVYHELGNIAYRKGKTISI